MDSNIGLDCIVDNPDYCSKLASALDTACTSVKKQVVELLSALCVYSQDARQRAIDTLHIYQERNKKRYRLSLVVDELQKASEEDYQTALLAFINCLVISAPALKDRVRVRNEFIGLKLLPILNELRKTKSHVPDLRVQLDAFDDQRETDEVLYNQGPPGIDLSSHVDIFYAILGQIADTPQEVPFLSILQHLLRLDPKDPASDLAWDAAETLVHRATLLENREDATKLLRSPSLQANLCCHCRNANEPACGTGRKGSVQSSAPPPPPPIPPAPPVPVDFAAAHAVSAIQPPPPPPPLLLANINAPRMPASETLNVPPPLPAPVTARSPTPEPPNNNSKLLPQQEIPTPKAKMKTINWNKIPNHKVIGKHNIWSLVATDHQNSPMADLDWAEMEGLFCQQVPPIITTTTVSAPTGPGIENEKRRREPTEISLLDGKRSLNVNIFLKQFRSSNENIILLIRDGGHDNIGAEKLRGLLKILPEVDELEMLKSFDGDKSKLGNAEKFFLQLVQVSNYKLRIECMLLKEEFAANMSYLAPSINSMILAGDDLMTNKHLQQVLYMVLVAGNFLNSGGYAGNAAGVKLSSLQKLTEIRANKPGMNLIHYVALQVEKKRKDLLNFTRNMAALDAATKTTVEQLTNEFNCLDSKIKKIKSQIQLPSTEVDIQEQMAQFLQMAEQEMAQLKRDMEELENVRKSLADFFCEDTNTFKIEECFKVFHQFCQKFNQAVAENERRRMQEEQAMARRKQREEQLLAKKRMWSNHMEISDLDTDPNLMDYSIFDNGLLQKPYSRSEAKMKRLQSTGMTSDEDISNAGSPNIRRRLGSCSGGPDQLSAKEETYSPDVTPNGTLRRRRSRIPCEDDENNLMDFLRSTGQDNARERKSWGSLDRSWAKRARGQPRRSDLLNVDFSGDRERPSSPSPLVENKPFLQEEESKPAGKAWRMKIEAWLSENEKEERAGEQLQRKAKQLQANRRSFEDSENEGKQSLTNTVLEDAPMHEYPRTNVYDWRSNVEKTDVLKTMEAVEEVQPNSAPKDKSPWRKSSLNVQNTSEDSDARYSRRRSRLTADNVLGTSTLQAIREEERKKNKASEPTSMEGQDELTIYIRQPYVAPTTQEPSDRRSSKSENFPAKEDEKVTATAVSDKIDIDSDNIETPPATRRLFNPPKDVKPVEKEPCKRERCNSSGQIRDSLGRNNNYTDLGSGNFDRFSAARRTRRYKNKDLKIEDIFEDSAAPRRPSTLALSTEDNAENNDAMLRVWQNKLKKQQAENISTDIDVALAEITKSGEDLHLLSQNSSRSTGPRLVPVTQPAPVVAVTNTVLSPVMQESRLREAPAVVQERAISSRERKRSMIDPSQVQEAFRLTSDPPSQVNNNSSGNGSSRVQNKIHEEKHNKIARKQSSQEPALFKSRFITSSPDPPTFTKTLGKEDLHDEGFEETQSLVSETLSSQETSSGNFETDMPDSTRCSPANMSTIPVEAKKPAITTRVSKTSLYEKPNLRKSKPDLTSSYLPKRTPSLKRDTSISKINVPTQHSGTKRLPASTSRGRLGEVERSGSRSSLRSSSRSSLNSASSVNTVKRLPPGQNDHAHMSRYTSAIRALTSDLRKNSNTSSVGSLSLKDAEKRRPTYMSRSGRGSNGSTASGPSVRPRVPASRSSSSGSSIGPPISSLRKTTGVLDRTDSRPTVTRPRSVLSPRNSNGSMTNNLLTKRSSLEKIPPVSATKARLIQPRSTVAGKSQSFMRPTAASVNKGSISNIPKSIKTALVK